MNLFGFTEADFQIIMLIISRLGGLFALVPLFGNRRVPAQVRVGLIIIISLVLFPAVRLLPVNLSEDAISFAIDLVGEVFIGATIGFVVSLILSGAQMAGLLIDIQMGFGMANIIDPISNIQVSLMGQVKSMAATLVYILLNGHHRAIEALYGSIVHIPLGAGGISGSFTEVVIGFITSAIVTAVKLGSPVLAILLLADMALGIMARTVPQMNVLMVGFPLKISVGLFVTAACLPLELLLITRLLSDFERDLMILISAMR